MLSQVEKIAKEALHLVESQEVTRERKETLMRGDWRACSLSDGKLDMRGDLLINLPLQCISEEALLPPHELNLFLKR